MAEAYTIRYRLLYHESDLQIEEHYTDTAGFTDHVFGLIGGNVNIRYIRAHWDEILRLATSIKQGNVTASLMLRKLGSYPRRVQVGLNKGEAKNALARAVFFNRLGEIRDRSFENQRYRASGLNLVVAAYISAAWGILCLVEEGEFYVQGHG